MNRVSIAAAVLTAAATVLSAALGIAPRAGADTNADQFLNDMAAAGFGNNEGNRALVNVGWQVCHAIQDGNSQASEAHQLWHVSQLKSLDAATQFVDIAVQDLCPDEAT